MIPFKQISPKPTTEWALTANANQLKATKETYSKYIEKLAKKCNNITTTYERGPKDRRLHVHIYLQLKKPINKFQFRKLVKPPNQSWSLDYSHKINNGWLEYITDEMTPQSLQEIDQQDCMEASARGDEREARTLKRRIQQRQIDIDLTILDFNKCIEYLFPNAQPRDILNKKYFKIYSKLNPF